MEIMKIEDLMPGDKFMIVDGPKEDDFVINIKFKELTITNIIISENYSLFPYMIYVKEFSPIFFKKGEEKYIRLIELKKD